MFFAFLDQGETDVQLSSDRFQKTFKNEYAKVMIHWILCFSYVENCASLEVLARTKKLPRWRKIHVNSFWSKKLQENPTQTSLLKLFDGFNHPPGSLFSFPSSLALRVQHLNEWLQSKSYIWNQRHTKSFVWWEKVKLFKLATFNPCESYLI